MEKFVEFQPYTVKYSKSLAHLLFFEFFGHFWLRLNATATLVPLFALSYIRILPNLSAEGGISKLCKLEFLDTNRYKNNGSASYYTENSKYNRFNTAAEYKPENVHYGALMKINVNLLVKGKEDDL